MGGSIGFIWSSVSQEVVVMIFGPGLDGVLCVFFFTRVVEFCLVWYFLIVSERVCVF